MIGLSYALYKHDLRSSHDRILSRALRYVDIFIYNVTCVTYITYKKIYYFVTCEISDVTMLTTCMNVIYDNEIIRVLFN